MPRLLPVLLLLATACATPSAPRSGDSAPQPSAVPGGARVRATTQEMVCPPDIVREPALNGGLRGLSAGEWVQDLSPATLQRSVGAQRLHIALPLAAGAHQLVAGDDGLALFREQSQGACVVNTWNTSFDQSASLQPAGSWRSADGRLAVLLLSVVTPREGKAPEQRWMLLGTDGRRLWPALGEAHEQLMVPGAALKERGGQLQLEVRQRRTSVYAFDPKTGRFITR